MHLWTFAAGQGVKKVEVLESNSPGFTSQFNFLTSQVALGELVLWPVFLICLKTKRVYRVVERTRDVCMQRLTQQAFRTLSSPSFVTLTLVSE